MDALPSSRGQAEGLKGLGGGVGGSSLWTPRRAAEVPGRPCCHATQYDENYSQSSFNLYVEPP